ncbi:hypothetical protein PMZ80_010086 [Knufia obscura]|uniref:Uncharacterized protein n=2 Tax=Knufia TaxID=430999 RepID=A0AAN8EKF4_9EURO|nr:hypothetical protein PMZ80_010086 [Knufia obscura]KAK5952827.1 hypothetical protein OHC33_005946 [Knufia fluminis]
MAQIEYLTDDLEARYSQALHVTRTSPFYIEKKPITEAYAHRDNCANLYYDIAGAIAAAINFGVLQDSDYKMVDKLKKKLAEFARDLEARVKIAGS